MIVANTNLIAYLIIHSDLTPQAEKVFVADHEWAAPLLWRSEFRSILARYLRRGDISFDEGLSKLQEAESLLDGREFQVSSTEILRLVRDSSCSAYDCEFVALAQDLGVPLVTSDRRILSDFPEIAVSMEEFTA